MPETPDGWPSRLWKIVGELVGVSTPLKSETAVSGYQIVGDLVGGWTSCLRPATATWPSRSRVSKLVGDLVGETTCLRDGGRLGSRRSWEIFGGDWEKRPAAAPSL